MDKLREGLQLFELPALGITTLVLCVLSVGVQFKTTVKSCLTELNGLDSNSGVYLQGALISLLLLFLLECAKRKWVSMKSPGEKAPHIYHSSADNFLTYTLPAVILQIVGLFFTFSTFKTLLDADDITDGICKNTLNLDLAANTNIGTITASIYVACVIGIGGVNGFQSESGVYLEPLELWSSALKLRGGAVLRLLVAFATAIASMIVVVNNLTHDTQCYDKPLFSNALAIMMFSLAGVMWCFIGADALEEFKKGTTVQTYKVVAPLAATRVLAAVVIVLTLLNHLAYQGATSASLNCQTDTPDNIKDVHFDMFVLSLVGLILELAMQLAHKSFGYKGGALGQGESSDHGTRTNTQDKDITVGGLGLHATDRLTSDKQKRSGGYKTST
jgi:hypothetical protein